MSSLTLKAVRHAILAAALVSTAAFAQPISHEHITVTPEQENVWGARIDVPNQEQAQAYVTKNVWGARIEIPANEPAVASLRAPAVHAQN